MTKEQKQVKEFMQLFGQECPDKPTIPSEDIRRLRAKLILEEALETIEALGFTVGTGGCELEPVQIEDGHNKPSLIDTLDGIADSIVVTLGTAVACGIDMEPIFDEVHRSNMSKMWNNEELLYLKNYYECIVMKFKAVDGLWIVKDKDGKVIKSPSYSPANLQPIIDAQK